MLQFDEPEEHGLEQALIADVTAAIAFTLGKQHTPKRHDASCQQLSFINRVLQVCARLGLTSLAYMWHQPQASLLTSMIEEGVHAVLCKVAAMGLKPKQHLGKSLAEMQPFLHSLRRYSHQTHTGEPRLDMDAISSVKATLVLSCEWLACILAACDMHDSSILQEVCNEMTAVSFGSCLLCQLLPNFMCHYMPVYGSCSKSRFATYSMWLLCNCFKYHSHILTKPKHDMSTHFISSHHIKSCHVTPLSYQFHLGGPGIALLYSNQSACRPYILHVQYALRSHRASNADCVANLSLPVLSPCPTLFSNQPTDA